MLWLSSESRFRADSAIRGGVPICFPWFGGGPADDLTPAHGYARLRDWTLVSAGEGPDGVVLTFALPAEQGAAAEAGPRQAAGAVVGRGALEATYRVTVGPELSLALEVRNAGSTPAAFEEALHTYLAVSDVGQIAVKGLVGTSFLDRLGGPEPVVQEEETLRVAGETDRIYLDPPSTITVEDPAAGRRVEVRATGSASAIVWNPWVAKARAMADFGDDEWAGMICVETANVRGRAITLRPGERHTMAATIAVLPLD